MSLDPNYELFVLFPAYSTLTEHLRTGSPRDLDPHDLIGPLVAYGHDRAACLLYAHEIGEGLADSHRIVAEILAMAHEGKRPRFGREMGFLPEHFGITDR